MKTDVSHIDTFTTGGTTSSDDQLASSVGPQLPFSCLAQPATVSQVPDGARSRPRDMASYKSMRDYSKNETKLPRTTLQSASTVRFRRVPKPAGQPARTQRISTRLTSSSTVSSFQQKTLQASYYHGKEIKGNLLPPWTQHNVSTLPPGDHLGRNTQIAPQPSLGSIATLPEAQHAFLVHAANTQPGSPPLYGSHCALSSAAPEARLVLQPAAPAYIAQQPVLAHVAVDAARGEQPAHHIHARQLLLHYPHHGPQPAYQHKYAAVSPQGGPVNMVLLAAPHIVAVPSLTQAQHQLSPGYVDHAVMNVSFRVPQHHNDPTACDSVQAANIDTASKSLRTKAKKSCANKRSVMQSSAKAAAKPQGKRSAEVGTSAPVRIANALNCAVDTVGRDDVPVPAIPLGLYMAPHSVSHNASQFMPARDTRAPSRNEDEYTIPEETINCAAAALMTSQPALTTNYTSTSSNHFGRPGSADNLLHHPHLPSFANRGGTSDSMPVAGFWKQQMKQDRSAFNASKRPAALQERAVKLDPISGSILEGVHVDCANELTTPSRLPQSNPAYGHNPRRMEKSFARPGPIRRPTISATVAEQLRQLLTESDLKKYSNAQKSLDEPNMDMTRHASQFIQVPGSQAPSHIEDEYIIPQKTIDCAAAALMTSQQGRTMDCTSTTVNAFGSPVSATELVHHSHLPSFANRCDRVDGMPQYGYQQQRKTEDRSVSFVVKKAAARGTFDANRTLGQPRTPAGRLNGPTTTPRSSLQQGNGTDSSGDTGTTPRVENSVASSMFIRPRRTSRFAKERRLWYSESDLKYDSRAHEWLGQSKLGSPVHSEVAGSLPPLQHPFLPQPTPNAMKKNSTSVRKRRRPAAADAAVISTKLCMIDKLDIAQKSELDIPASIPQSSDFSAASQDGMSHKHATTNRTIDHLIEPKQQRQKAPLSPYLAHFAAPSNLTHFYVRLEQAPSFQQSQASKSPTEELNTTAPPFPEDLPSELLDSIPDLEDEPADWQDLTCLDTSAFEVETAALGLDADSPPRDFNLRDSGAISQITTRRTEELKKADVSVSWTQSVGDNFERSANDEESQPKGGRRCLKLKFNCSGPSQFDLAVQDDDGEDCASTVHQDPIVRKLVRTGPPEHRPHSEQMGTQNSLFSASPARNALSGTLATTPPTKNANIDVGAPSKRTPSISDETIKKPGDRNRSRDDQRHWQGRKDRLGRLSTRNLELREQFASTCGLCHHRLDVDDDVIRCAGSIEPCNTAVHAHCAFASGPGTPRFRGDIPSPERWRCRKCASTDVWASPGKLAPALPDD